MYRLYGSVVTSPKKLLYYKTPGMQCNLPDALENWVYRFEAKEIMDLNNGGAHYIAFTLDWKIFALPLFPIVRAVRAVEITPLPKVPSIVMGIFNFMGEVIPLLNICERFHLQPHPVRAEDFFIIFDSVKRRLALHVDSILDHIEVSPDSITTPAEIYEDIEFISGCLPSKDGVLLVPDLDKILTLQEEIALDEANAVSSKKREKKKVK